MYHTSAVCIGQVIHVIIAVKLEVDLNEFDSLIQRLKTSLSTPLNGVVLHTCCHLIIYHNQNSHRFIRNDN